jgi:hypothetical protein
MTERHAHRICVLFSIFILRLHYFLRLNVYAVLRCACLVSTLCMSACLLFDC